MEPFKIWLHKAADNINRDYIMHFHCRVRIVLDELTPHKCVSTHGWEPLSQDITSEKVLET